MRRRGWERERGSALLEFAFVFPVYLLMVMGGVQFGLILFGYCSATYATTMIGRYVSTHGSGSSNPCTSLTTLQTLTRPYLWGPAASATVGSNAAAWPLDPGDTVTLTVSFQYPVVIPFTNIKKVNVGTAITATILQ